MRTPLSTSLYARTNEPRGRHIEASLMQAAAGLQVVRMTASYLEGGVVRPTVPPSGIFRTSDGWMSFTVIRAFEWSGFCEAIDHAHLIADPRFATPDARIAGTEELTRHPVPADSPQQPSAHWAERMTARRVMHEKLNTFTEFVQHPHVAASGALAWVHHPAVPQPMPLPNLIGLPPFQDGTPRAISPGFGEHTAAILREHGYSAREINDLAVAGVIGGVSAIPAAAD